LRVRAALALACLAVAASALRAQSLAVAKHDEPPPGELAPALASRLAPGGARITIDATTLDVWLVTALDRNGQTPGASGKWSGVAEGALVGALRVSGDFREIRGKTVLPGVYTLRLGIQPANGDHLGASAYREFLLVSPAAGDRDPAPAGHDGAVTLSKATIGTSHPASLSIDPPESSDPPLSRQTTPDGFAAVALEVPGKDGPLRFGLVVVGKVDQ
jgi:hypothetical protein